MAPTGMNSARSRIYFPGLGLLRFLAALAVFFSHIELLRSRTGLSNHYGKLFVSETGRLGVTFFFVLSGFLITYLLLHERETTGTIRVGKFYMRRILRIWPLYFLVVILAFFVLPHFGFFRIDWPGMGNPAAHFSSHILLFLFFLPHLALSLWLPVPFAEPLWSIGVEEQFYLLWPLLVKSFRRSLPFILAGIMVAIPILRWWFEEKCRTVADPVERGFWVKAFSFAYYSRFECMAAGALAAWLLKEKKLLKLLFHPLLLVAAIVLPPVLLLTLETPVYQYLPYAACFAVIILNIAANPKSLIRLSFRWGDGLGNLSFAFYLFHEIAIVSCIRLMPGELLNTGTGKALLTFGALGLTLLLSWISYRYFERFFLRKKEKFQPIAAE